jgi:hypothetical protein
MMSRDIIIKESGSHFDPEIVKAFLENEQEIIAISEAFREDREQSDTPSTTRCPAGYKPVVTNRSAWSLLAESQSS